MIQAARFSRELDSSRLSHHMVLCMILDLYCNASARCQIWNKSPSRRIRMETARQLLAVTGIAIADRDKMLDIFHSHTCGRLGWIRIVADRFDGQFAEQTRPNHDIRESAASAEQRLVTNVMIVFAYSSCYAIHGGTSHESLLGRCQGIIISSLPAHQFRQR